jgi:hypothetical protein
MSKTGRRYFDADRLSLDVNGQVVMNEFGRILFDTVVLCVSKDLPPSAMGSPSLRSRGAVA